MVWNFSKLFYRLFATAFAVVGLSSCQFGFMSLESEKKPERNAVSFSSDPTLIPSELHISFLRLTDHMFEVKENNQTKQVLKKVFRLGTCEPIEVVVSNSKKVEVPLLEDKTVELKSENPGGTFYTDSNCSTLVTSVKIPKGVKRSALFFKADRYDGYPNVSISSSAMRLKAVAPTFTSVLNSANVVREISIAFYNSSGSVITSDANVNFGNCYPLILKGRDVFGNVVNDKDRTITFSQSSDVGDFYNNNTCTTSLSDNKATLPGTGSNASVTVYFKTNKKTLGNSTAVTFSATDGSISTGPNNNLSITILRFATSLAFYNANSSAITNGGNVDFGSCYPLILKGTDALGNIFNNTDRTLTFTQSPNAGTFYSNNTCSTLLTNNRATLPGTGNDALVTVYFKPDQTTLVSPTTVVFSATDGAISTAPNNNLSITIIRSATILAFYNANNSAITNGGNVDFGSCYSLILKSRDALGNIFNNTDRTITFAQSLTAGAFYINNTCSTLLTNNRATLPGTGNNASVTVYFRPEQTTLGNSTAVAFSATDGTISTAPNNNLSITILRFATSLAFYDTSNGAITNGGNVDFGSCYSLILKGRDALGNIFNNTNRTITLSQSLTAGTFYSNNTCSTLLTNNRAILSGTGNNASVAVYFRPDQTSLGNSTAVAFSATDGTISTAPNNNLSITILRFATSLAFYDTSNGAITNGGNVDFGSCYSLILKGRDALGNIFNNTNRTITLSQSLTAGTFYSNNTCSTLLTNNRATLSGTGNNASVTVYFRPDQTSLGNSTAVVFSATDGTISTAPNNNLSITILRFATGLAFYDNNDSMITSGGNVDFGSCYSLILKGRDALGNIFNNINRTITFSQSVAAGVFYSNNTCSTLLTNNRATLPGTGNDASVTVYFKANQTTLGNSTAVVFSATDGTISTAPNNNLSITIIRSVTSLAFYNAGGAMITTDAVNFEVCLGVIVKGKDNGGNFYGDRSNINLSKGAGTAGGLYANSNCNGTASDSLDIQNTNGTALFYFKTSDVTLKTTSVVLSASSGSVSPVTLTVSIHHLILDTGFGTTNPTKDGRAVLDSGEILSIAKISSGYLVAGYRNIDSVERGYVALVNSTGSGLVAGVDPFSDSTGDSSRINSIAVEVVGQNTNIYFAGTTQSSSTGKDWFYGKLNLTATGLTPDTSFPILTKDFSTGGVVTDEALIGIETSGSDKVVLVDENFRVAVVPNSSGTIDLNVNPVLNPSFVAVASDIKKDSSERIVVAGISDDSQMAAIRFDPQNLSTLPDVSKFGSGRVNAVAFDLTGKILLAGKSGTSMAVTRLNNNFTLDTSFGISNRITDSSGSEVRDIKVDSIGQILIAGTKDNRMLIKRYQSESGGAFKTPNPPANDSNLISFAPVNSVANRIILDGLKIVLGGLAGSNMAMARLLP